MYYIALLEAYKEAEEADNWFSAGYMQALQILIVKEGRKVKRTTKKEGINYAK
jgi:hypothetical protein